MDNTNCTKYILVAFNLLFLLTGIILIIVGNNIAEVFSNYSNFLVLEYFNLSLAIIIIGAIVLLLTIVNCWTILKQKYNLNLFICILLGITAILALTAGGLGFKLKSQTKELIRGPMHETMLEYQPYTLGLTDQTVMWDYLQKSFTCCGLESYKDWESILKNQIPLSCCYIPYGIVESFNCTASIEDINRNSLGCLDFFGEYIETQSYSLGTSGIAMGVILIIGVLLSLYFNRTLKKAYKGELK